MDKRNILFIGGDERQIFCAKKLYDSGYEVSVLGFEKFEHLPDCFLVFTNPKIAVILADVIILPTPMTTGSDTGIYAPFSDKKLEIETVIKHIDSQKIVFGGKADVNFTRKVKEKKAAFYDVLKNEPLTGQNAYLTAEGCVHSLMEQTPEALFGKSVLIIGFGRIAKHLIRLLSAFKMNITVAARKKSDLTLAKLLGCKSKDLRAPLSFQNYDFVVNTVPVKLFKNDAIGSVKEVYADLAPPGEIHAQHYLPLSGVPGKYAPRSAGIFEAYYILQVLSEVAYE